MSEISDMIQRLCPVGVPGEDPAALVVAVGVVRQAHCAGELPNSLSHKPPYRTMGLRLSFCLFLSIVLAKSLNDWRLTSVNI